MRLPVRKVRRTLSSWRAGPRACAFSATAGIAGSTAGRRVARGLDEIDLDGGRHPQPKLAPRVADVTRNW